MQRILLVKTTSLGDVIHCLPAASDVAAHFPGVRLGWVVEEPYAGIVARAAEIGRPEDGGACAGRNARCRPV